MTRIIEDRKAHYETHEVPFGRSYEWHPEQVDFECDCGRRFAVTSTSPATTCPCGADHSGIVRGIRRRGAGLLDEANHHWLHDDQEQEEQHQRDDAAHPECSPWRYNDITSR